MLNFLIGFANVMMVVTSVFLICLVLIQRGKGGGLAGAFGGVGGSSAFGTKAGDVFTRVTIYVASFWFLLALFLVYTSNSGSTTAFSKGLSSESAGAGEGAGGEASDKDKGKETDKVKSNPPLDVPSAEKTTAPAKTASAAPAQPAVPLNPARAGMKETTDLPPAPAKTP